MWKNNPKERSEAISWATVFITYSTATPEMINAAREVLKTYGKFKEVIESQAGSVINSHCGKNTLGILYLNDGDEKRI